MLSVMGHFPFLLIKLKFQWAIISQFNIAISVINWPFFWIMCLQPMAPHYPNHYMLQITLNILTLLKTNSFIWQVKLHDTDITHFHT